MMICLAPSYVSYFLPALCQESAWFAQLIETDTLSLSLSPHLLVESWTIVYHSPWTPGRRGFFHQRQRVVFRCVFSIVLLVKHQT